MMHICELVTFVRVEANEAQAIKKKKTGRPESSKNSLINREIQL